MTERSRADRSRLRACGVCVLCQRADADEGFVTCRPCRVGRTDTQRRRREACAKHGICISCQRRKSPKGELCGHCRRTRNKAGKAAVQRRRKQFLCTRCGGEIEFHRSGWRTCQNCANKKC